MAPQTLFNVFLVEIGLLTFIVNGTYVDYVSSTAWDGVGFYISVRREVIQNRLDAYHSSVTNECGGGKLLRLF